MTEAIEKAKKLAQKAAVANEGLLTIANETEAQVVSMLEGIGLSVEVIRRFGIPSHGFEVRVRLLPPEKSEKHWSKS